MVCVLFILGGVVGFFLGLVTLILGFGPLAALAVWSLGGLASTGLMFLLARSRPVDAPAVA